MNSALIFGTCCLRLGLLLEMKQLPSLKKEAVRDRLALY